MLTLILFAAALSSDAFAVAMARGACSNHRWRDAILLGIVFALFEGGMTVIGWYLGIFAHGLFDAWGRYLVVFLLVLMGSKMIRDALSHDDDKPSTQDCKRPLLALMGLCGAGFAISLDAAACGVALPLLGYSLLFDALLIGGLTLVLSITGYRIGGRVGARWGNYSEVAGGVVLILLGVKVLFI